jgi:transposase
MIRTKTADIRLFYGAEELHRPSRSNFYSRLDSVVGDWTQLCEPLRGAFSPLKDGRPTDPVVYFKIFLVGYLENITFDTDLAERVADSLAIREFVGYGPCEKTPDHSSVWRVRTRLSQDGNLGQVFDAVVSLCARAGLIGGQETAVDSTLLPANASLSSLRCVKTQISVQEHLRRLSEAGEKPSVSNEDFVSPSDPQARISKKGTTCPRGMYHKATCVADFKRQVIVATHVSGADEPDPEAAIPALESAKTVLESNGLKLRTVVGDAGFDDSKFHARIEQLGAVPITNYTEKTGGKPQGFTKADFTYDQDRDLYVCPRGFTLKPEGLSKGNTLYRSKRKDCAECPFKASCITGKDNRRTIGRPIHEQARVRNIARCHTPGGRKALRRRKAVVEPPFAHMKRYGGLRQLNCRGSSRVQTKLTMAAIAWNLLKLVKHAPQPVAEVIQLALGAPEQALVAICGELGTLQAALEATLKLNTRAGAPVQWFSRTQLGF